MPNLANCKYKVDTCIVITEINKNVELCCEKVINKEGVVYEVFEDGWIGVYYKNISGLSNVCSISTMPIENKGRMIGRCCDFKPRDIKYIYPVYRIEIL